MGWLDGVTNSMVMSLSKLGRQWRTGVLQSVGPQSRARPSSLAQHAEPQADSHGDGADRTSCCPSSAGGRLCRSSWTLAPARRGPRTHSDREGLSDGFTFSSKGRGRVTLQGNPLPGVGCVLQYWFIIVKITTIRDRDQTRENGDESNAGNK